MSLTNWLLVLLTAATFAASLPFNKLLVADIAPLTLSSTRVVLALPFVLVLSAILGVGLPKQLSDWRAAFIGSVFLIAIPFFAIAFGQQYIPSGLGGILYGLMPLVTVVIASLLISDEYLNASKAAGCLLGLTGVSAIIGPSAFEGSSSNLYGVMVTLVAPVSYSLGTVLLRILPASNPLVLMTGMFSLATVYMVPLTFVLDGPHIFAETLSFLWPLAGLATLGTAVPAYLNYILIRRAGAVNSSLVMFIMPAIAVVFGILFFKEQIGTTAMLGLLFIVAGCVLVSNRTSKKHPI